MPFCWLPCIALFYRMFLGPLFSLGIILLELYQINPIISCNLIHLTFYSSPRLILYNSLHGTGTKCIFASVPGILTLFPVLQFWNILLQPRLLKVLIPLQLVSFETKDAVQRQRIDEVYGSYRFTLETWGEENDIPWVANIAWKKYRMGMTTTFIGLFYMITEWKAGCSVVNPDPHNFDHLDPQPDPHPHQLKNQDPDPHQI